MKNIYFSLVVAILLSSTSASAQVIRNFTPRYKTDAKGRMVFVSNNIITTKQRPGGNPVSYTSAPPNCPAAGILCKNDNERNTNIDIDGDPSTFNSSAASVSFPECSGVEFAALYWGAGIAISQGTNGATPMSPGGWNQIRFKAPGGVYQTVTANQIDTVATVFHGYQSFADVTSLVRAGGSGEYTIANVKCDTVNSASQPIVNAYGGWTMVVVYRDSTQPLRNMTIFDGLAVVRNQTGDNTRTITVTGFQAPPAGAVSAKFGMVVYDGDRAESDGFEVRRNGDGIFVSQTNAGESASGISGGGDAWNSSITDTSSIVSTRNPAHQNTYGYDAHIYKLNNASQQYLRNNDNSAQFRLRTSSEGYVLGLVTSEIDTYEPELLMENTVTNLNGPSVDKGDTLLVTTRIRNTGTDQALQVSAANSLPAYFRYVPNSIILNGTSQTDASGDDAANYDAATRRVSANIGAGSSAVSGGNVPANNSANYLMTYRITISDNCSDIGVTPVPLLLQSKIFYAGQASGIADSAASRPMTVSSCVQPIAPDTLRLLTGCNITLPVKLVKFAGVAFASENRLSWTVEEHNDGLRYELQSSTNGSDYNTIYTISVPAQEGLFDYAFSDKDIATGSVRYYRVKLVSIDGAVEYSHVVMLQSDGRTEIVFSPNPVTENAVTFRSSIRINRLEWYNTSGVLVKAIANPVNGQRIDVSELSKGVYFIKAFGSKSNANYRMIKL